MPGAERFTESEIAAIFEEASQAQQREQSGHGGGGLTLAELTQVGVSAGIDARFVTAAAASIRASGSTPRRVITLGQQVSVGKTVALSGPVSQDDWNALVVDLQNTFDARGHESVVGPVREWRNGNLRVSVEPSDGGSVLRFRSLNSNYQGQLMAGAMVMLSSLAFMVMHLVAMPERDLGGILLLWTVLGAVGLALAASAAIRLPRWRRTREQQMDDLALRAAGRAAHKKDDLVLTMSENGLIELPRTTEDGAGDSFLEQSSPLRRRPRERN